MNKKRFLKSILATSALAAALAPNVALGVDFYLQANPSQTGTVAEFNDAAGAAGAAAADLAAISAADNIKAEGLNVGFQHDAAAAVTVKNFDRNGVADTYMEHDVVGQTMTVQSISSAQADRDVTIRFGINSDAVSIIDITAQTAGLKNLGTVDAKNETGIFQLNPGANNAADYTGVTFQSTGGNNGTVAVKSGTVTLGTFAAAGTAIKNITIADAAKAVTSAHVVLAGGNGITLTGTGKLTVKDGHNVNAAGVAAAAEGGHLVFEGDSTWTGAIGAAFRIGSIKATGASAKHVQIVGAVDSNIVDVASKATFTGALTVIGNGLAADADAFKTGAGLVTFAGAETKIGGTAGRLKIGSGGITTNQDLTIGKHGSTGAGKLTFTAAKTLTLEGDYAATGDISTNNDLTINGKGGARTISAAIKTTDATKTLTFTDGAGAAASLITITKDIGEDAAAKTFANVTLTGANDRVLLDGAKVYSTAVTLANNASELQFTGKSNVKGAITANAGGNGIIVLKGTGSDAGSKDMTLAAAALGEFRVDAAASGSTLTIGATDANKEHTINKFTFNNTAAGDNSGLVIDLSNVTSGNNYELKAAAGAVSKIAQPGAHGMIKFDGNVDKVNNKLTITLANNFGTKANHLSTLDATDQDLTIVGSEFHTANLYAKEVTLNGNKLGMYGAAVDATPGKINVTTADAELLEGTKLKAGTQLHFLTNNALTINKDIKFDGYLTSNTTNEGLVTLKQGSELAVTSVGTSDVRFNTISIADAGQTATVKSSGSTRAKHYTNYAFGAVNGTLKFEGDLHGSFTSTNTGTLVLQGGNVTQNMGAAGNIVAAVEIDTAEKITVGTDTDAVRTMFIGTLKFKKDGTLVADKNVTTGAIGVVTTDTDNTGSVELNQNITTGGNVGTKERRLKSVTIGESKTLTVDVNHGVHVVNVDSGSVGDNNVTFNGVSNSAGTTFGAKNRLATVTIGGEVTADGFYTKDLALGANKVIAKVVNLTNAATGAGTIELTDGGSLHSANVKATEGAVIAKGSASINGNIDGALTLTGGSAAKVVSFTGSKVVGLVTSDESTLALSQNTEMSAGYTGSNASIDLGSNVLTVKNAPVTLNGANTNISVRPGAQIKSDVIAITDAAGTVSLKLRGGRLKGLSLFTKEDGSDVAITAAGAAVTDANFKISDSKLYKDVKIDATTGAVTFGVQDDIAKFATTGIIANANSKSLIQKAMNYLSGEGSDDAKIDALLDTYQDLDSEEKQTSMVARLAEQRSYAGDSANSALQGAATEMRARSLVQASSEVGVAAGDAADKYGLWVKGTFGTATQKLRKDVSGYKSNTYGAFVGADTMLNDNASVGLVVGYNNSKLKHKDVKAGDKTKANSWMFGAYGSYDFSNNFFVQANAALAQTSVKARSQRVTGNNTQATATGKYDVMGYTAEVRGGYKFRFDNSLITPTAGLRFNYLGDTSYTETGAGVQNVKNAGKATTGIDAVAGLMLSTTLDVDGLVVMPEVHMNVDYALSNQAPKADYNLDGSNVKFSYKGAKPAKFGYNFGASVMTQTDNIEYGVGYDARISDKYMGHQGSVKVKVSF